MRTSKQSESSRQNGQQSHGPCTPDGKRISSRNSFKTGLYAQSLIIQGEKREDFETLQNEYYTHYQPQSPAERDLLDTMLRLVWQQRRYAHVEAELWDFEVYEQTSRGSISRHYPLGDMFVECGDKFSRLQRMQNAAQAKFKDALHELEHLQAARPAQLIEEDTQVGQAVSPADGGEARNPVALAVLPPAAPAPGFVPPTAVESGEIRSPSWFDPATIWSHPPFDPAPAGVPQCLPQYYEVQMEASSQD